IPTASATAFATSSASRSSSSSTSTTPSGNARCTARLTSRASRVLPTPPGPVRVTRRDADSRRLPSSTSRRRPTKLLSSRGSPDALLRTTVLIPTHGSAVPSATQSGIPQRFGQHPYPSTYFSRCVRGPGGPLFLHVARNTQAGAEPAAGPTGSASHVPAPAAVPRRGGPARPVGRDRGRPPRAGLVPALQRDRVVRRRRSHAARPPRRRSRRLNSLGGGLLRRLPSACPVHSPMP